ncbi:cupin domain-containing protein [Actinomadura sp. B10D3]|uniref:cupin domain-containing protein n=1 Tax=Actinomadura sp. B10D3 TaxID=3153557 RepID=UPI00325C904C
MTAPNRPSTLDDTGPPESAAERRYAELAAASAAPLWRHYGNLFSPEPKSRAVPYLWRYAQLRPHAVHFSESLSLEDAERRVLMLVNPGLQDPPATLNSLFAGLQIIMPGESAQAHRHTANAFRFIIEGSGASTTVDGEPVPMRPGDLLLTPGWRWHDHTHNGDGPMIWLDGLDYPLVNALEAGFFEQYGERLQRHTRPAGSSTEQFIHGRLNPVWRGDRGHHSPVGNYPWTETERALAAIADDAEGSAFDGIALEYTNPWNGGPVMPTISCRVQRLRSGFSGRPHQHTANVIFHVVRGEGTTEVDGVRMDWADKDVFAVPAWSAYRHLNPSRSDAVLFAYSDEPVFRTLGLYRSRAGDD